MKSCIDYKEWSSRFASITEDFVWIHSGSSSGGELNKVFRDAINALVVYKKEVNIPAKISLKRYLEDVYHSAVKNGLDPWEALLKAIAERADDWEEHASDENEVTQDIRSWLTAEAEKSDALPASRASPS